MENNSDEIIVKGKLVNEATGCVHYHSSLDVIAIKFKCCQEYYPCYYCHEETAGHLSQKWTIAEYGTKAILCGVCKNEMTIQQYFKSHYKCPFCKALFNPKCSNHNHLYFEE